VIRPPVAEGTAGQASVTAICGAVLIGQVTVTACVTVSPVHLSEPLAVSVSVTEHTLSGAV